MGDHVTVAAQMRAEARDNHRDDLARRTVTLAAESPPTTESASTLAPSGAALAACAATSCASVCASCATRASPPRRASRRSPPASPAATPATDTGNGFYGKYQFDLQTWQAVGGTGNPADASEAEQDRRATMLYEQAGASPWPACGR